MVGTGKLLAAGHVTSYCSAYISGRQPVSPPLASKILDREDLFKKKNKNTKVQVKDSSRAVRHRGAYDYDVLYDAEAHTTTTCCTTSRRIDIRRKFRRTTTGQTVERPHL